MKKIFEHVGGNQFRIVENNNYSRIFGDYGFQANDIGDGLKCGWTFNMNVPGLTENDNELYIWFIVPVKFYSPGTPDVIGATPDSSYIGDDMELERGDIQIINVEYDINLPQSKSIKYEALNPEQQKLIMDTVTKFVDTDRRFESVLIKYASDKSNDRY